MAITQGLYNVGGVNIPDLGISEGLNSLFKTSVFGPNNLNQTTSQQAQQGMYNAPATNYSQLQGSAIPPKGTLRTAKVNTVSPVVPQYSQNNGQSTGFNINNFPGYAGWDPQAAFYDWQATGGAGKGGTQQQPPAGKTVKIAGKDVAINGDPVGSVLNTFKNSDYGDYASQMTPEQFGAAIDATYQPALDVLGQSEQYLKEQQPGVEQGIAQQNALNQKQLGDTRATQMGVLNSNKNTAIQRKESALAAARRLYSELQQGARQRYGGASSAGEGASILMGNEQQRQMGQTQRDTQNALSEIDKQGVELENNYNTQKMQLETQFQSALRDAQSEFQNRLLQINSNKAQTEQAKAQARLQNLIDLRNQANAINAQKMQYAQQLDLMKQQSAISLQEYKAKLGMAGTNSAKTLSTLFNNVTTNPQATTTIQSQKGSVLPTTINNSTGIMAYNPSGVTKNDPMAMSLQGNLNQNRGYDNFGNQVYNTGYLSPATVVQNQQAQGGVTPVAYMADGRIRYSDGSVR